MRELDDKQMKGAALFGEMMGEEAGHEFLDRARSDSFGSEMSRMAASACFHDAWGHPGLTRREKSIAIISMLIALKQPEQVGIHVKAGLRNGLTPSEIEGIFVQLVPYVGFPAAGTALSAIMSALKEEGAL